ASTRAAAAPDPRRRPSPHDRPPRRRPRRCWTTSRRSWSAQRSRLQRIGVRCEADMSLVHTCYRITDIDRSVEFYKALGFDEKGRIPIRDEAINVFMGLPDDGPEPRLELTYNIGREEPYEIGTG